MDRIIELSGPNGLRLSLDADEIHPDDPGAGTPAMVYKGRSAGATYWCALDTGELTDDRTGAEIQLTEREWAWLDSKVPLVDDWMDHHYRVIEAQREEA